ncbi:MULTISPECIES: tail fiber assembly protein [Edwardsiella]|uniref:tail fiber assembly protein n=1 Tax=Edwardsiella TaxID=635 RepID=UPI000671B1D5
MKYFKDSNSAVYAYPLDGSQDNFIKEGLISITEKEAMEIVNPPPTHEELVVQAEAKKQVLIAEANDFINSKQWPGKAALGRLKVDEVTQYNLWLDYLDALEAIDTSTIPNIIWPVLPAA